MNEYEYIQNIIMYNVDELMPQCKEIVLKT
jgi:hypothetical protein